MVEILYVAVGVLIADVINMIARFVYVREMNRRAQREIIRGLAAARGGAANGEIAQEHRIVARDPFAN